MIREPGMYLMLHKLSNKYRELKNGHFEGRKSDIFTGLSLFKRSFFHDNFNLCNEIKKRLSQDFKPYTGTYMRFWFLYESRVSKTTTPFDSVHGIFSSYT